MSRLEKLLHNIDRRRFGISMNVDCKYDEIQKGWEAKTNVTLYYLHYHGAYLPLSLILTDDREPLGQITVICHPGGN